MLKVLTAALLGAGMMASGASAAPAKGVEVTDGVYHKSVCKGPVSPDFARCFAHVVTDSQGNLKSGRVGPNVVNGYGPPDLQSAYAATSAGSSSTTVAIVDAFGYDNAEADMGTYRANFSLPPCTTANGCFKKVNQKGHQNNYPTQNIGWAQESALDLDMVSAMCSNCKIILVEATSNSFKNLAAAVDEAAALGAHVISNSYGGGERHAVKFEPSYNHPGVAITASTGDSGFGAQFPATSQHVTAVGGTTLQRSQSAPRGWTETVWAGAGSGCSDFFTKPTWQKDRRCSMRMEADVSADANPATGVAVFGPNSGGTSQWLVFGGTSVAAPLVGGVYGANGGAVNYGSDPYHNKSALNDVTSGHNGTCAHAYFCNGEVGYDGPTGLGTPIGDTAF